MWLIGDLHGDFDWYLKKGINGCDQSITLGDIGIGFPSRYIKKVRRFDSYTRNYEWIPDKASSITLFPEGVGLQHRFVYGNHDNSELAVKCPNCLGHYGYLKESGIFFISGAFSVDRNSRTDGIDWWETEEIAYKELAKMIELYQKVQPRIVVSHEGPSVIVHSALGGLGVHASYPRTRAAMDQCWESHMPEFWFLGHYHQMHRKIIGNTDFRIIADQHKIEIPKISW